MFDKYQVDLVLNGHDHDYERSFPVRGFDFMAGTDAITGAPVETLRPHPATTTDTRVFGTTHGTVHLVLGGGGTCAPLDVYGLDKADGLTQAKVFTRPNRPVRPPRPVSTCGPRPTKGAPSPTYTEFETVTLIRPRSRR